VRRNGRRSKSTENRTRGNKRRRIRKETRYNEGEKFKIIRDLREHID
jgi:hypothetical protein